LGLPTTYREVFGKNHIRILPEDLQEKGKAVLSDLHFMAPAIALPGDGTTRRLSRGRRYLLGGLQAGDANLEHLRVQESTSLMGECRWAGRRDDFLRSLACLCSALTDFQAVQYPHAF